MKKTCFLIFILVLFLTGCCRYEEFYDSWGIAKAELNGEKWKGKPSASYSESNDTIAMKISVTDGAIGLVGGLFLDTIPLIAGTYQVTDCFYTTYDGDTPLDEYKIDFTQSNIVQLLCFNERTKVLEAEFDLHFIKGPGIPGITYPQPDAPEKLHFEEGHLKTKIIDR